MRGSPVSTSKRSEHIPKSGGGSTRDRILSAGVTLFAERGFEATSTRAIGTAAQANIAMIAYHFGDKEGLYRAVLETTYERMLEIEFPATLPNEPAERVRVVVDAAYRFGRSRKSEVRLLLRHVIEHGSLPEEVRASGTAKLFEKVGQVVESVGLSQVSARKLELMSINHLLARYIVSDLADVAIIVGTEDPQDAVSRHLGDIAVRLLLPSEDHLTSQGR